MANGNGSLTPARTIGISLLLTTIINGVGLVILQEHGNDLRQAQIALNDLRLFVNDNVDGRYRQRDATADFSLVSAKLDNVAYRFRRNEKDINQCLNYMEEHRKGHNDD